MNIHHRSNKNLSSCQKYSKKMNKNNLQFGKVYKQFLIKIL